MAAIRKGAHSERRARTRRGNTGAALAHFSEASLGGRNPLLNQSRPDKADDFERKGRLPLEAAWDFFGNLLLTLHSRM